MAISSGQLKAQPEKGSVLSVGARRRTKREYETVLIVRPRAARTDISTLVARVQQVLAERAARLLRVENWGIRVLAYSIKRESKGIYMYFRYIGGSDVVAELERNLRILDLVLRYHTVRVDEDVDPDARPSEITPELLDAVTDSGPDPEEEAARAAEEARLRAEAAAAARAAEEAARESAEGEREAEREASATKEEG
jgi:small subunit ribosomal protein S6